MTPATPGSVNPQAVWLSRKLAATYMSVSVQTIDRWARAGLIKRYEVEPGRSSARYKRTELDALMKPVEPPFPVPENLDPDHEKCEYGYSGCGCLL